MTAGELRTLLAAYPEGHDVVLAGDARLALVTHGGAADGRKVVVLSVEAAPLEAPRPGAIAFTVTGIAQAQGSARAFMPKGGRFPVVTSSNPKLRGWRHLVADAAGRAVAEAGGQLIAEGAVRVIAAFYLPRPKAIGAKAVPHVKAPDLDKLQRSLGDAMSGVVFRDDSQITGWKVTKGVRRARGSAARADRRHPAVGAFHMTETEKMFDAGKVGVFLDTIQCATRCLP